MTRGEERKRDGEKPTKYFGKWPLKYVYGIQVTSSLLSGRKEQGDITGKQWRNKKGRRKKRP
ncbi:hypothetical protein YC2023_053825 [Brassica napus]